MLAAGAQDHEEEEDVQGANVVISHTYLRHMRTSRETCMRDIVLLSL
jgi:hypothetical protein